MALKWSERQRTLRVRQEAYTRCLDGLRLLSSNQQPDKHNGNLAFMSLCTWRNQRSREYERERRNWKGNEILPPRGYSGSLCVGRTLTSQSWLPPIHAFSDTHSSHESSRLRTTSSHPKIHSHPITLESNFQQARSQTMPLQTVKDSKVRTRNAVSATGLYGKPKESKTETRVTNKKEYIDSVLRKSAKSAILVGNTTPLRMTVKVPAGGHYSVSQESLNMK